MVKCKLILLNISFSYWEIKNGKLKDTPCKKK